MPAPPSMDVNFQFPNGFSRYVAVHVFNDEIVFQFPNGFSLTLILNCNVQTDETFNSLTDSHLNLIYQFLYLDAYI